jgi:hypothetical protein
MDPQLQRLIGELREETCPSAVLERVHDRISREGKAGRTWRYQLGWSMAMVAAVFAIGFWQWHARQEAQRSARTLVIQQTYGALALIGQTLLEAAAHTENALLEEAVPPLRNGLETAKNKVTNPI